MSESDPEFWDMFIDEIVAEVRSAPGSISHAQDMHQAAKKRFTQAELAAEYWRALGEEWLITEGYYWEEMCGRWSNDEADAITRTSTLLRFASQPHYDEVEP